MLNKSQIALLHLAKKELGLDDGDYRDILYNVTGGRSTSSADRNFRQTDFANVMKLLKKLGFQADLRMTQRQLSTILKMNKKIGWERQPWRMEGYAERVLGFKNWKMADVKQAGKLIQAMVSLVNYENKNKRQRAEVPAAG